METTGMKKIRQIYDRLKKTINFIQDNMTQQEINEFDGGH